MLSPGPPPLCRSGAAASKVYSHPQTHTGLLIVSSWVKFLPKVLRSVSSPAPYTVPSQLRKFVHNLLGSWSQIRSWPLASCLSPDLKIWSGFYEPALLYSRLERIYGCRPSRHPFPRSCWASGAACRRGGLPLLAVQRNCEVVCLWTQPSSLYSPWQLPTLEHIALHGVTVNYATLQLNSEE